MNLVFLDTETGGLDCAKNPLLQIGAVDQMGGELSIYIKPPPNMAIEDTAKRVNGWPASHADKQVVEYPVAANMLVSWLQCRRPDWIVCHHSAFDYPFVRQLFFSTGTPDKLLPGTICTKVMGITLREIGGLPTSSVSLSALLEELAPDYKRPEPHDALEDAKATKVVYDALMERFSKLKVLADQAAALSINKPQTHGQTRRHGWGMSGR
jgi:DNA polymerase III epsilon subunit-like protein